MISTLLIVVALLNASLAIAVGLSSFRKYEHVFFSGLSLFVGVWAAGIAFYFLETDLGAALIWAKVYYIAAATIALFMSLFAASFHRPNLQRRRIIIRLVPWAMLILPIAFYDNFLTRGIILQSDGRKTVDLGTFEYALYTIFFLPYFFASILSLFSRIRSSEGIIREQLRSVFLAISIAGAVGVLFNLILPWFGNYSLIWVGPALTTIFVLLVSYSMYKHKLFDFKLILARSLAYALSITTVAFVYFSFSLIVTNSFLNLNLDTRQLIALSILTVLVSSVYAPTKEKFNTFTNRIFYRDQYDSESLINQLGDRLVISESVKEIFELAHDVIYENIAPETMLFIEAGLDHKYNIQSKDAGAKTRIAQQQIKQLEERPSPIYQINASDELQYNFDLSEDFSILLTLKSSSSLVGYLLLGPRKSGTRYTQADLRVFSIISNELSVAIENAQRFEQIKGFNVSLQAKIKRATSDLVSSNKKLKALDEAKDEFIGMASHQLRTPLTSVKGYLSMVIEGDAGKISSKQEELLSEAYTSSQRMVYLIADLLNVSRLKTGKFVIEKSPINLAEVVEGEIRQLKETAKSRKLTLEFHKPRSFPTIELDETKTRQVIMNFADNAIYYTPPGGKISIRVKATKDTIEYRVIDSGIGVKNDDQKNLFTKFFRASNARKARPDGTGLGLYMAKKVIIAQGGSVIFESKEGKGSTFGFSFTRKKSKK